MEVLFGLRMVNQTKLSLLTKVFIKINLGIQAIIDIIQITIMAVFAH